MEHTRYIVMFCCLSSSVVLLSVWMAFLNTHFWSDNPNEQNADITGKRNIVIGILSARENFDQRDVIRKTWLHTLKADVGMTVKYVFVLGKESCTIPRELRRDEYSCLMHTFSQMKSYERLSLFVSVERDKTDKFTVVHNASVIVQHPVSVHRLGLHIANKLTEMPITVVLSDIDGIDIISVRFSLHDPGIVNEHYRYQRVTTTFLPKKFQGYIRVYVDGNGLELNETYLTINQNCFINNSGGTVNVEALDSKEFLLTNVHMCHIYMSTVCITVLEIDVYKEYLQKKVALMNKEIRKSQEITEKLELEHKLNGDLLFVGMVDVYRSLPKKLLLFHEWVQQNGHFDFVMKTDDDCMVNIEKIISLIGDYNSVPRLWWGNFREEWLVEPVGKWAEKTYRSSVYPTFACGSGNIVSKDINEWLALNSKYLHLYQGEDTSMGIWLGAIAPGYVNNDNVRCEKHCSADSLIIPQLTVEEMQTLWDNKLKCGNQCGCE